VTFAVVPGSAIAARPSGNVRLARALPEGDDRTGVLTIVSSGEPQRPFGLVRAEPQVLDAPRPAAAFAPALATVPDMAIRSERLGAVRIGIEGAPGELRVSLGLSPAAASIVAADTPRLVADLAAGGVRLQSLDLSGSGFAGGQGPSQGAPQQPPQSGPGLRTARQSVNIPVIAMPARTADRYA
jgi:hypothetical protein